MRVCRIIKGTELQNVYNYRPRRLLLLRNEIQLHVREILLSLHLEDRIMRGSFLISWNYGNEVTYRTEKEER